MKASIALAFLGRLFSAFSTLLLMPLVGFFYGDESIGLIGFFSTMVMFLMVLEGGLTSHLIKTVSKLDLNNLSTKFYSIFNVYLLFFIIVGFLVFLGLYGVTDFIVAEWLVFSGIDEFTVRWSIVWMSVYISANFPVFVMQSSCTALGLHVQYNSIFMVYSVIKVLGCFLYLTITKSSAVSDFFFFLAVTQILYLGVLAMFIYRLGEISIWFSSLDIKNFLEGLPFSARVFSISLMSVVLVQFDRLYLSGVIDLSVYGGYAAAAAAASVPYILSSALYTILFPRFSSVIGGDKSESKDLFGLGLIALSVSGLASMIAIVYFSEFLFGLLFSESVVSVIIQVVVPLFIGSTLQSLQVVPYAYKMAVGWTSLTIKINLISLPVVCLLVPYMFGVSGIYGVALVWMVYNLIALVLVNCFFAERFSYLKPLIKAHYFKIILIVIVLIVFDFFAKLMFDNQYVIGAMSFLVLFSLLFFLYGEKLFYLLRRN